MAKVQKNKIVFRSRIIFVILLSLFIAVAGKLAYLQIVDYKYYQEKATRQQLQRIAIPPMRGMIQDRNGKIFANSVSTNKVCLDARRINDDGMAKLIADTLSEILSVDREKIYNQAQGDKYVDVKVKIEDVNEINAVRTFISENKLGAQVVIEDDVKRKYPLGNVAAQVVGFLKSDDVGQEGMEVYMEKYLKGVPGRVVTARNALGNSMNVQYEDREDAENGLNVKLTIDDAIQHFLEKRLEIAYIENNIQNKVSGIVMNVKTGEILAMATKPDFDLNAPRTVTDEEALKSLEGLDGKEYDEAKTAVLLDMWRNRAIGDPYEPGSTFKIVTAAIALEENLIKENDSFYCPGHYKVANETIHCWRHAGHGSQTFVQGLENSCNPVFMQLGERIGADRYFKYFEAFGFTQKTGIDMIGEASNAGLFHSSTALKRPLELATTSFGQTFKITPLQLITAVSAVANGGYLMEPYIIKELTDSQGNVKKSFEPQIVRHVISESTSKKLCEMLGLVVSEGTGKNAYVAGYRIGGKTATSEKTGPDERDENGNVYKYICSFVGVAPADDPQVAVLIILDEPKLPSTVRTGGVIAAPVCRDIFADILPYLGVEPKYTEKEMNLAEITVPNCVGEPLKDAQRTITGVGISSNVIGKGTTVVDQLPKAGQKLPSGSRIILYTESGDVNREVTVPDLTNMTVSQVNNRLGELSLNIRFIGASPDTGSLVIHQSPEKGEVVTVGTVVSVEFRHMNMGE